MYSRFVNELNNSVNDSETRVDDMSIKVGESYLLAFTSFRCYARLQRMRIAVWESEYKPQKDGRLECAVRCAVQPTT